MAEDERTILKGIIRERSYRTGQTWILSSGKTSDHYFDLKPTLLYGQGGFFAGRITTSVIYKHFPEARVVGSGRHV